nr:hypothetical protein [Bacteroides intestinalis]
MNKVGIVGNGFHNTMLLVAETKGNKITDEQLNELAVRAKCSVSQIEVVPEEKFEIRAKELEHTYTITSHPEIAPIPNIYMDDISFGLNKHKLRTYTESDIVGYNKKISKRRKKNKNKKTHRR